MGRRRGGMARVAARPAPRRQRPATRPPAAQPGTRRRATRQPGERTGVGSRPRPPRRRWGYGAPWPDVYPVDDVVAPAWGNDLSPGDPGEMAGLSAAARRSLARLGLLRGVWPARLRNGGPALAGFLNRFHAVAGVGRVVEDYFDSPYARAAALLAMRLSERLAARSDGFQRELHYDRRITFAPDGQPILAIVVGHRGVHYRLFPWRRLHEAALRRQMRRDRLAFGSPDRVRWVFDRKLMAAPTRRVLDRAGRILGNRAVATRLILFL